jgi:hypothetical protein
MNEQLSAPLLDVPVLEFLATVTVELGTPLEVGQTPLGRRRVIPIAGGTVSGVGLSGTVLPGGADWQTVLDDGTGIIDARYCLELDSVDGPQLVSLSTAGVRTGPAEVLAAIGRGEMVPPTAYYFRFTAAAVTASQHFGWLSKSLLLASGARSPDAVRYDLYRLT